MEISHSGRRKLDEIFSGPTTKRSRKKKNFFSRKLSEDWQKLTHEPNSKRIDSDKLGLNTSKQELKEEGCWRHCPDHVKNKNIILLDHYGSEGLNDRGWIFNQVVQLAGYLCATVRVPPPRTMVSDVFVLKW